MQSFRKNPGRRGDKIPLNKSYDTAETSDSLYSQDMFSKHVMAVWNITNNDDEVSSEEQNSGSFHGPRTLEEHLQKSKGLELWYSQAGEKIDIEGQQGGLIQVTAVGNTIILEEGEEERDDSPPSRALPNHDKADEDEDEDGSDDDWTSSLSAFYDEMIGFKKYRPSSSKWKEDKPFDEASLIKSEAGGCSGGQGVEVVNDGNADLVVPPNESRGRYLSPSLFRRDTGNEWADGKPNEKSRSSTVGDNQKSSPFRWFIQHVLEDAKDNEGTSREKKNNRKLLLGLAFLLLVLLLGLAIGLGVKNGSSSNNSVSTHEAIEGPESGLTAPPAVVTAPPNPVSTTAPPAPSLVVIPTEPSPPPTTLPQPVMTTPSPTSAPPTAMTTLPTVENPTTPAPVIVITTPPIPTRPPTLEPTPEEESVVTVAPTAAPTRPSCGEDWISTSQNCFVANNGNDNNENLLMLEFQLCHPQPYDWIAFYYVSDDDQDSNIDVKESMLSLGVDDNYLGWTWTCGKEDEDCSPESSLYTTHRLTFRFNTDDLPVGSYYAVLARGGPLEDRPPYSVVAVSEAVRVAWTCSDRRH